MLFFYAHQQCSALMLLSVHALRPGCTSKMLIQSLTAKNLDSLVQPAQQCPWAFCLALVLCSEDLNHMLKHLMLKDSANGYATPPSALDKWFYEMGRNGRSVKLVMTFNQ